MAKQFTKSGPGRTHAQGDAYANSLRKSISMRGWYSKFLAQHFATQRAIYGNTGRVV